MENRNGQGIFYGVIGVATLIVAIIGATFAFFSATANTEGNAITTNSTTLNLTLTPVTTGLKAHLIPVDALNAQASAFKTIPGITANDCKDNDNNFICSTYQFNLNNPNDNNTRVFATMTTTNSGFENLHYAIFRGTAAQVAATSDKFDVTVTPVGSVDAALHKYGNVGDLVKTGTFNSSNQTFSVTDLVELEQVIPANSSVDYTIVLWIEETGSAQNVDSGKNFSANIEFSTGNGSSVNGVTAVLGS